MPRAGMKRVIFSFCLRFQFPDAAAACQLHRLRLPELHLEGVLANSMGLLFARPSSLCFLLFCVNSSITV